MRKIFQVKIFFMYSLNKDKRLCLKYAFITSLTFYYAFFVFGYVFPSVLADFTLSGSNELIEWC
jgi:hypothetical protein